MYCTLYDYVRLPPEQQRQVTHVNISIASPEDYEKVSRPRNSRLGDSEEYVGEAKDRGL